MAFDLTSFLMGNKLSSGEGGGGGDSSLILGMEFETGVISLETATNTMTVNFTSHSLEKYDLMGCLVWTDNSLKLRVAYDAVLNAFEMLTDMNPSGLGPNGFVSLIYRYKESDISHFYQFNYNAPSNYSGLCRPNETPPYTLPPSNSILFGATNNSVKIGSMHPSRMFLKSFEYKYVLFFKPKS